MKLTSSQHKKTNSQRSADTKRSGGSYKLPQNRISSAYGDSHSRIMNNPDLPRVVHDSSGLDAVKSQRPSVSRSTGQYYPDSRGAAEVRPDYDAYTREYREPEIFDQYDEDDIIEGEHMEYDEADYAFESESESASGADYASESEYADEFISAYPPEQKPKKRFKALKVIGCIAAVLTALYFFCVYTTIPFIANLRTLYVETAMMTMNHQWLATAFLPKSVIDEFRHNMDSYEAIQDNVESNWSDYGTITYTKLPSFTNNSANTPEVQQPDVGEETENVDEPVPEIPFWLDPDSEFYQVYYEIDFDSFSAYAEKNRDTMFDENGFLFIDEADVDSKGTGIRTTNGDEVLSIDTVNGIIIARLSGTEYHGVIAIVKDPTMVGIAVASKLGVVGQKVAKLAENSDAVIAINASGFEDPDGLGNGGIVHGLLYKEGKKIEGSAGGNYKAIYFDSNYRLNVTAYSSKLDIYNGIEFKPALVVNGKAAVTGSFGWGIQPRTAIGQTEDGSVIMIVINGRSTSSVGITVGSLAQIFLDYGAVQAGNLDGGSSSVMYYNGRIITSPCGGDKVNGRYLPDAFVVYRKNPDNINAPEPSETE